MVDQEKLASTIIDGTHKDLDKLFNNDPIYVYGSNECYISWCDDQTGNATVFCNAHDQLFTENYLLLSDRYGSENDWRMFSLFMLDAENDGE